MHHFNFINGYLNKWWSSYFLKIILYSIYIYSCSHYVLSEVLTRLSFGKQLDVSSSTIMWCYNMEIRFYLAWGLNAHVTIVLAFVQVPPVSDSVQILCFFIKFPRFKILVDFPSTYWRCKQYSSVISFYSFSSLVLKENAKQYRTHCNLGYYLPL